MDGPVDLTRQLAHEIQAPLTSLELQLRKLSETRPESELVADCLEEVESLKQLVTSFLELGTPEPPELAPSALELAPVFHAVEKRFRPIAAARNVKLQMECGSASAVFDARATERILANLVDNAIKFSRDRGTVHVFARARAPNVALSSKCGTRVSESQPRRVRSCSNPSIVSIEKSGAKSRGSASVSRSRNASPKLNADHFTARATSAAAARLF